MLYNAKNLSSKNIAGLAALVIAVFSFLPLLILGLNWIRALIYFGIIFLFSYYFLSFVLEQFVYRKIKLIYKFISKEKASIKEDKFNESLISQKSIEDVKEDVEIWAREQRVEIMKLQGNEAFRKEFLMNLAHELRTPIFAIQGYLSTLLDGELENPEVNLRFLESASKSADRLSSLVEDVDKISKYESNRIVIVKSIFGIQTLIKDVFVELMPKATQMYIELGIKKGCESEIRVLADKEKIKQVLINLIENAIKYGKHYGNVLAGIYLIDNDLVLIEITDDGMGIEDIQVGRVFERFYRTDAARTKDNKGNGLGLAIVKHIVEAHGQSINCRSSIGRGSTFGFTLSVNREKN